MKFIILFAAIAVTVVYGQDDCSRQDIDDFYQCMTGGGPNQQQQDTMAAMRDEALACIDDNCGGVSGTNVRRPGTTNNGGNANNGNNQWSRWNNPGRNNGQSQRNWGWNNNRGKRSPSEFDHVREKRSSGGSAEDDPAEQCMKEKMMQVTLGQCNIRPLSFLPQLMKEMHNKMGDGSSEEGPAAAAAKALKRELKDKMKNSCNRNKYHVAKQCIKRKKTEIMGDKGSRRSAANAEMCGTLQNCKILLQTQNARCADYMERTCSCMAQSGAPDPMLISAVAEECGISGNNGGGKSLRKRQRTQHDEGHGLPFCKCSGNGSGNSGNNGINGNNGNNGNNWNNGNGPNGNNGQGGNNPNNRNGPNGNNGQGGNNPNNRNGPNGNNGQGGNNPNNRNWPRDNNAQGGSNGNWPNRNNQWSWGSNN